MYSDQARKLKCSKCGEEKETTAFSPAKNPRGYRSICRACDAKRSLEYHHRNRELVLPKLRQRQLDRYAKDPRLAKYYGKTMCKKHVKRAMPNWANEFAIRKFYLACPEGMTVDHIVPLRGKTVCGLHVEWNLQYLTASENSRKHNKLLE